MRTHSTPPTPLLIVSFYFALRFSHRRPDPFIVADIFRCGYAREPHFKAAKLKKVCAEGGNVDRLCGIVETLVEWE